MADGSVIIDGKFENKEIAKGIEETKTDLDSLEKEGINARDTLGKIGSVAGTAMKGVATAVGIASTAVGGLVAASVSAYADYEQLVGGVDTLFGDSSQKLQDYANVAYKTAGVSANEYMETVTSFSASLLQSLGGDTEKAADYANQALIDMSDNANKMGTDMESIQWAYQGFAKQNFTMLDNLKLGYGGTQEEMKRLLADAEKLSGIEYDISSFADVTQAIHVIQENMGIAGTTALEASTTIEGSLNSVKGAWENLLVGMANPDADWDTLIQNLVDTVTTAGENLLPAIERALVGVSELIDSLFPLIAQKIPEIVLDILPNLVSAGVGIVTSLMDGIQQNLPALAESAISIIDQLLTTILELLPQILEMGIQLIVSLAQGLAEQTPELVPQIIDCVILIAETLLDNIDMLIDAGIELILGLAEGLIEALPDLIDKIPTIIDKVINAITNNLPKLIQAGITLIIKLAEGLIKAIPQLVSKIPQIIGSIVSGFANYYYKLGEVGLNLVKGLWNGISDATGWLWSKISGFCSGILNKIKGFFGIHSPSKVFNEEIGKYLAFGLGEGFDDNLGKVYKQMQSAVDLETQKLSANLTNNQLIRTQLEDNRQATLQSIDDNKEIVVNTTTKLDSKVIARETNKANARQKLQYGLA